MFDVEAGYGFVHHKNILPLSRNLESQIGLPRLEPTAATNGILRADIVLECSISAKPVQRLSSSILSPWNPVNPRDFLRKSAIADLFGLVKK
jgi:hypothetical protein